MEFDKSRVYTALNADELKVGDIITDGNHTAMVTVINVDPSCKHIFAYCWLSNVELER